MSEIILIVAAHADDETLGCGGTIAKHVDNGDIVYVIFMTDGVSSRADVDFSGKIVERGCAADKALSILGVKGIHQFNFPDNKMDTVALLDVTQALEKVISEIQPSIIYTHFRNDLNIDHQVTHQAVMTVCRPQSWSSVKKILSFEVLSSTEWNSTTLPQFTPNYIVDISKFWHKKLAALKFYEDEMRKYPHSRSYKCVEALAVLRGATNGFEKAEAFFVERVLA